MYDLEMAIARAYDLLRQSVLATLYRRKANKRRDAMMKYCWNDADGFFYDYDFVAGSQTGIVSMASAFPLFSRMIDAKVASRVVEKLESDLLKPGGFVNTVLETGEQWDSPNGWAPLHWVAINGLRQYSYHELADEVTRRWTSLNIAQFNEKHKLVEKYDVLGHGGGGGGEYPLQDGFGWTNGVLIALLHERSIAESGSS
jgi:alpha,alpha-trehalase